MAGQEKNPEGYRNLGAERLLGAVLRVQRSAGEKILLAAAIYEIRRIMKERKRFLKKFGSAL